jgi:uncharacterized YigZ family protein
MASNYLVPLEEIRRETVVVNSRFIATLAPVFTPDQAKAFVARIRVEFADASHNVPVYLLGGGNAVIEHCSDDGEPSGTAGRPALAVLKGSGLGDAAVVVTRYFGGTKLGTGGLVRAYSEAVRLVVDAAPRAQRLPTVTVMVGISYRWVERLRRLAAAQGGRILEEDFAADVTVSMRFPADRYPSFEAALRQASNDTLQPLVVSEEEELIPLGSINLT